MSSLPKRKEDDLVGKFFVGQAMEAQLQFLQKCSDAYSLPRENNATALPPLSRPARNNLEKVRILRRKHSPQVECSLQQGFVFKECGVGVLRRHYVDPVPPKCLGDRDRHVNVKQHPLRHLRRPVIRRPDSRNSASRVRYATPSAPAVEIPPIRPSPRLHQELPRGDRGNKRGPRRLRRESGLGAGEATLPPSSRESGARRRDARWCIEFCRCGPCRSHRSRGADTCRRLPSMISLGPRNTVVIFQYSPARTNSPECTDVLLRRQRPRGCP